MTGSTDGLPAVPPGPGQPLGPVQAIQTKLRATEAASMDPEFYGRGLSFPLQLGVAGLGASSGVAKVEESIRIILGTGYGERVMRPTVRLQPQEPGLRPQQRRHRQPGPLLRDEGLTRWEPRIEVVEVSVRNDNLGAALLIDITYRLRATQDVRNLVYPFYLERT